MPSSLLLDAAPFLATALGLAVTLYLFVSVKVELRRSLRREREQFAAPAARAAETTPQHEPVYVPVAAAPGFNLRRRTHALRLLKRGQDAARIAAVLGIPRAEVELLIRVEKLVAEAAQRRQPATST
jgi:hypothetical protein